MYPQGTEQGGCSTTTNDVKFVVRFAGNMQVNTDEYKTSKIVLQRVDSISGQNFDTFEMGSHASDYTTVLDKLSIKYSDPGSIVDGATTDVANVTLGNGGSYQKKIVDIDLENLPVGEDGNPIHPEADPQQKDLFWIDDTTKQIKDKNGKKPGETGYVPTY